ncbi:serine protease 38 isoform X1 [Nasonia vitripennis]|uniref:Peptidase S1 domain-containing protein n=2 Tax=Nasonia vitripennis TaxID=7425 RepID=A0A7M7TDN0_NASVI|nr:serine protease 38 isoform X1 [Nasonia vitripennis]
MERRDFSLCLAALICCFCSCQARSFAPRLILGGDREMVHQSNFSTNAGSSPNYFGDSSSFGKSLNMCDNCVCGVSRQTRIVNGDVTSTYEFPWAVAITYQGMHHCGASLITRRHLLTAGHCISGFQKKYFGLRFADNQVYRIKSMKVHEQYDRHSFNNDIAIIELDREVPLDSAVKTVCLPDAASFNYVGRTAVAIGWGRIGEGEPVSEELRKVDLPIMSRDECELSEYPKNRVTENMFCAGYLDGERDSCNGDSGGPLQVRGAKGAMRVVGLVSFGRGCARPNFPGVYTKVTNYLDWIGEHVRGECVCSPPSNVPQGLRNSLLRRVSSQFSEQNMRTRVVQLLCLLLLLLLGNYSEKSAAATPAEFRRTSNRTGRIFFDDLFGIDVDIPGLSGITSGIGGGDGSGGDSGNAIGTDEKIRNCTCDCGAPNQENRIVGGRPSEPNKYPWLARLVYDGKFHCGASLLTNDYVITAAHCVRKLKRSKIRIILGDHDQFVTTDGKAVMRYVGAVIPHRNFDTESYNHDVALLKLRRPVSFSKTIRPVCLPQPGSDPAGKHGTVVGWGRTKEGGMLAGVVQEVTVPVLSLNQCRRMKYRANRITENMVCAGNGSQDSCQGDSGGPLLIDEGGRLEIAGIVSWGVGCGRAGYPGVYTRVTRYLNWIRLNMKNTCLCNTK